ncbi:MAG: hypothetical protein II838_07200 [Lachnospiraceae bacterium]|nr:hypothetical protein [Lachnospiraceae bacterium]
MIYKEIMFLKSDWKRFLLTLVFVAVMIGYFAYNGTETSILMFLSFSVPGFVVSLETIHNSISKEKMNGMFEKMLTLHKLSRILIVKAVLAFIVSVIVTLFCSGFVTLFLCCNQNLVIGTDVLFCQLAIAICADWTISIVLVVLYLLLDQMFVINACVMGIMLFLSVICCGVVTADSILLYTISCCAIIFGIGMLIAFLLRYIPNRVALK